jgi:hypothetical protein
LRALRSSPDFFKPVLRDPSFQAVLSQLPGYDPACAGAVMPLAQAYPALGEARRRASGRRMAGEGLKPRSQVHEHPAERPSIEEV